MATRRTLRDLLIPHAENGYQPHFFRDTCVAVILGGVLATFLAAAVASTPLVRSSLAAIYPRVLVALANDDRADRDLPTLATNPLLEAAAQLKANDMVEKGYFAHNSPEGVTPWHWFTEAGYPYLYAGENLAVNFTDSDDVNDAWMSSPSHRANIVGTHYTEIGIATAEGRYQGRRATFVVQMFGSQKLGSAARTVAAAPAPAAPATVAVVPRATSAPVVQGAAITPGAAAEPSFVEFVATNPGHFLRSAYGVVGLVVLLALVLLVFIEIRHQHPRSILVGLLLLVILVSLYVAYQAAVAGDVVIAGGDLTAAAG